MTPQEVMPFKRSLLRSQRCRSLIWSPERDPSGAQSQQQEAGAAGDCRARRRADGQNERTIFETLMQREKLGSTAVGNGIAIRTARCRI